MREQLPGLGNSKALILVGESDFGRCRLASRLHPSLWPLGGRPVLERLVEHIAAQGIGRVVICGSERNRNQLAALKVSASVEVQFRFESLPRGTAGAIGDALEGKPSDLLLFVFYGAMLTPPELPLLMREHQQGGGCATLFFDPCGDTSEQVLKESGICVCRADIAQFIPVEGYFDFRVVFFG